MKKRKLSRGVAVVGGGLTKLGLFKDRNCKDFFAEAFVEMTESVDKGFDPKEIDAIYVGNYSNDFFVNQAHWGPIISDLLGHACRLRGTEAACAERRSLSRRSPGNCLRIL
jgi:acetyl-CoA acetyltransferase